MFAIWRLRRLSYTARVLHFLAVVYVLAIVLMLSVGSASLGYLLGPPLIAAILLNLRSAMVATLPGVATLVVAGATGHIELSVPGWGDAPLKASLVAAINYSTVGVILSLTCSSLLQGLSRSLGELELTSAAVARLNDMVLILGVGGDGGGDGAAQPVIFVNDAFLQRTGHARSEVLGQDLRMLQGPDADAAALAHLAQAMATPPATCCSNALRSACKGVALERDMVARIGGDEFVILLEARDPCPDTVVRQALDVAARVRAALSAPLELDGRSCRIAASIGVALALPGAGPHDLLREADTAMYHAKAGGRDGVMLFDGAMLAEAQQKLTVERELGAALEHGELAMHLQLQVDRHGATMGAELLMR